MKASKLYEYKLYKLYLSDEDPERHERVEYAIQHSDRPTGKASYHPTRRFTGYFKII